MKTRILVITAISAMLISTPALATIFTVDNNAGNNPTYTTVMAAHNAAVAGDTIYVVGSGNTYSGAITLTKRLVIFGPGYFLNQNPQTQARPATASLNDITFNSGSEGSLLAGITVYNHRVIINVSNIVIRRCRIHYHTNAATVEINGNISNVVIKQCYITNAYNQNSHSAISLVGTPQNIIITNNYIDRSVVSTNATSIICAGGSSSEISNNVIEGRMLLYNCEVTNNILRDGTIGGSTNNFKNNIGNSTQFGTADGNQNSVDMANVFLSTGSSDGRWQLKAGSPAIGAGTFNTDMGMFGGYTPYVLSGLPDLPHIFFLEAATSGSGTTGLPVHIKAKVGGK